VLRTLNDALVPRNGADRFKGGDRICKKHFKDPFTKARFRSSINMTIFERWFKSNDGLDVDLLRISITDSADRLARRFARGPVDDEDAADGAKYVCDRMKALTAFAYHNCLFA
jgi:hypothetical protein